MTHRKLIYILVSLTLVLSGRVFADAPGETEDLMNESDAALAETKGVKERLAKERSEADRALQAAKSTHSSAVAKRQAATDQLHNSESEIQNMATEKTRLIEEGKKLDREATAAQEALKLNHAKIEKAKAELTTLKELSKEKTAKLLQLNTESENSAMELKDLERQQALAQGEFDKVKAAEKTATDERAKAKEIETQKKARLKMALTDTKANTGAAPAVAAGVVTIQTPASLPSDAPPAEIVSESAGRKISSAPAPAGTERVLKRDCRFFDGPFKGSKVLGIKFSGTSVVNSEEGKSWISFQLSDGQKGYAAKSCF